jgi:lipid-A-disaccharide synthase
MPNLILRKPVVEELIQGDASPEQIALAVERILGDKSYRDRIKTDLAKVRAELLVGDDLSKSAANRAAERIVKLAGRGD